MTEQQNKNENKLAAVTGKKLGYFSNKPLLLLHK
jgi:hypothetical protein